MARAWTLRLGRRRHLPALDLGGPAVGEEDEDLDALGAAEGLDRGRAGVAGGGADDGDALAGALQARLEELADQLHRHVLEGERRAVEELEQPVVRGDLDEGHAGGVAEAGVGAGDERAERGLGEGVAGERREDAERGVLVGEAGEGGDLVGGERRPGLGEVEAAVAGETCEHRLLEAEDGGGAAGRDVIHGQKGLSLIRAFSRCGA